MAKGKKGGAARGGGREDGVGRKEDAEALDMGMLREEADDVGLKKRRRRRKVATEKAGEEKGRKEKDGDRVGAVEGDDRIKALTEKFRLSKDDMLAGIEVDPDFMSREEVSGSKEYDMVSAVMGTGRPNRQGAYLLPYLQTGHIIGLMVVLAATFVYLPGFPLTELPEEKREILRLGLEINYAINALLSIYATVAAGNRDQPKPFWALKTLVLGGLALDELRSNVPLKKRK